MCKVLSVIICVMVLSVTAFAHPGRTDSDGGHYDNFNEEYHYHHGKPAHQHYGDECPYEDEANGGGSIAVAIGIGLVCGVLFNRGWKR